MARGFIRGALWGAGISLGAVTLVSVALDTPQRNDAPPLSSVTSSRIDTASDGQQSTESKGSAANRVALTGAEVPIAAPPAPDTLAGLDAEALNPAGVPETGVASALSQARLPDTMATEGLADINTTAPLVSAGASRSLSTPATEPDLSISTEPAQPPAPRAVPQQTAFADPDESVDAGQKTAAPTAQVEQTPDIAAVAVDPVQPAAPVAVAQSDPFAAPEADVEAAAQDEIAETDAVPPATQEPQGDTSPVAMTEAPAPTIPQAEAEEAVSQGADVPDAPQPQPTTEVAALGTGSETGTFTAPKVGTEAEAPTLTAKAELETPATSDPVQRAGESVTASVDADIKLDTGVRMPVTDATAPKVPEAVGKIVPPATDAPAVAEAAAPDETVPADVTRIENTQTRVEPAPVPPPASGNTVRVNRLPTLGADPETPETEISEEISQTPAPEDTGVDGSLPPIERYAQPFENPDAKPMMSIVLMDEGVDLSGATIGLPALRQFPYPVSFAVDASLPDAAERMRQYRAEGFEVLAMLNFPEGATASDAETNLSVALNRLPQVVGIIEGVGTGVQTTRDSGRQVAQILTQTGHGFITQNQGLNTVQKLAARQGVPSAVVFRDFDAQGQNARVIRRFLDQAAFRAGQEGGVIMLGRLREQTVAALLVWALEDRAAQVALAPVSAVLTAQTP